MAAPPVMCGSQLFPVDNSISYNGAKCNAFHELCHPADQARLLSNRRSRTHMQRAVVHSAVVEQRSLHSVLLYRLTYIGQIKTYCPIFYIFALNNDISSFLNKLFKKNKYVANAPNLEIAHTCLVFSFCCCILFLTITGMDGDEGVRAPNNGRLLLVLSF